ncbi:anthrone oxygenase family protein [Streptomyces sp. NPDC059176]|uniref:anthrone oxygenase family protein n=1 Tax=unclassified Streptomyces TaxID=2593676 RepID=UPI00367EF84C
MRTRILLGMSLLSTGLLAGAFGYGAANLVPTFNAVPIDMRLHFHTELMKMNGITMQGAMAVSALSTLALAALTRDRARALATTAGLLTVTSFLITRFGNVPINGRIKQWAATTPPADHAEILRRWELFNDARTCTAIAAFAILIYAALRQASERPSITEPAMVVSTAGTSTAGPPV